MMESDSRDKLRVWLSHPTCNTLSRTLIGCLERDGLLDTFYTCIAIGKDTRGSLASKVFGQRRCPIPEARIQTQPTRELLRLLTQKLSWTQPLRAHERGPLCVDRIYHGLDRRVARELHRSADRPDALYAFEDGALASFEAARQLGVRRIYDQPIGYWRTARTIQSEEAERKPEWAATMPALRDSVDKVARKDAELQLADHIFAGSRFTAQTLKDAPFDLPDVIVVPYGCPPVSANARAEERRKGEPLKVLYVGSLSQRKGLAYLLEAVEGLRDLVSLTLVGRRVADCKPLDAALQRHRWIESLPHDRILETMREHDVFVFPSLFEGFGLVMTEALSQGLPVIATPHTAAPDLIEDGREGFLVPIRDSGAIAEKLELLARDRDRLNSMRQAAMETAKVSGWDRYERGVTSEIRALFKT